MKEGQLEQTAFELSQALKIIIGDIKSKPNDTRYLSSLKVGANALLKYDELRFSKEGQTQEPAKIFIADFKNKVLREKYSLDKEEFELMLRRKHGNFWNDYYRENEEKYIASLKQYPATWLTPEMDGREMIKYVDFEVDPYFNNAYPLKAVATTQEPVGGMKCNGNCGMNYCDEHGCIENKPEGDVSHLLTPPPSPVGIDVEALAKKLYPNIMINECTGPIDFDKRNVAQKALRNAFKAGYSASLPQSSTGGLPKLDQPILDEDDVKGIIESESSTEEEKDLLKEVINLVQEYELNTMGRNEFISNLLSTYKISKR